MFNILVVNNFSFNAFNFPHSQFHKMTRCLIMALFRPQRAGRQALKRPSIVSDFALSICTLSV
jgi:hypothetical protein